MAVIKNVEKFFLIAIPCNAKGFATAYVFPFLLLYTVSGTTGNRVLHTLLQLLFQCFAYIKLCCYLQFFEKMKQIQIFLNH